MKSPYKTVWYSLLLKNAFYFTLKAPFFLKIFEFCCLDFLVMYKNVLIRLISKLTTSEPEQQTMVRHNDAISQEVKAIR